MSEQLQVTIGQSSDKGRKPTNQDFYGAFVPDEPTLSSKGIALGLADGISTSNISRLASENAIRSLLEDYYCTSDTWSVKKSVTHTLSAVNSWLYSQSQKSDYRYEKDKGYVCTLSALVIKSATAHIFHLGDCRVYRLRDKRLECLTTDHRLVISEHESYLSRALGIHPTFECDYQNHSINKGDTFLLLTDGVYEHCKTEDMINVLESHEQDLNTAAQQLVDTAYSQGSEDNLTAQIIRIDTLPEKQAQERLKELTILPFPPILNPRNDFDGYHILSKVHSSSRSHVYLAKNTHSSSSNSLTVIKTPSIDLKDDPAYLERFLLEEWIAKRINNAHVLKPKQTAKQQHYIYTAFEHIDGQTLTQWMRDNPTPNMQSVRKIVTQIAKGLMAFHRLEMIHQDLRPDNVMIDKDGIVKIIDFGSTKVAGVVESKQAIQQENILGTAQYTAPEYFLGEPGTHRSDIFSLGVITYQMLTGELPYGTKVAGARTYKAQQKLNYKTALKEDREIPAWVDTTLKKAVHPSPHKRYQELSEFIFELEQPSAEFLTRTKPPVIERNPVAFWQSISALLTIVILFLLAKIS
ncbi:bifunctional protein-serine/threonine kinase/phosphatase [Alteromonadaceae bacterium M269]|nr:bifunctional protein-serine/threonine kinase/phosphatase [Alteromonadaceae bacterium M269]